MENQIVQHLADISRHLQRLLASQNPTVSDPKPTFGALVAEFVLAKERAGRCRGYVRRVPVTLKTFLAGREGHPLSLLAARDIEEWLAVSRWAARTRRGYLLNLRTVLNFAVRRGYLAVNPALAVDLPAKSCAPPQIHTPDQVRAALTVANNLNLDILRTLAIRYFAGLRSAETLRLDESHVHLEQNFIEVPAAISKTRQRRLVVIQPNLREWLAVGGRLPLRNPDQRWAEFTRAFGPWPRNVARHSFCTYHLVAFENAGRTALQAGHSEAILFRHYRELVTPAAAKEFWRILPATGQGELPLAA